jgi:hypothetical protein
MSGEGWGPTENKLCQAHALESSRSGGTGNRAKPLILMISLSHRGPSCLPKSPLPFLYILKWLSTRGNFVRPEDMSGDIFLVVSSCYGGVWGVCVWGVGAYAHPTNTYGLSTNLKIWNPKCSKTCNFLNADMTSQVENSTPWNFVSYIKSF